MEFGCQGSTTPAAGKAPVSTQSDDLRIVIAPEWGRLTPRRVRWTGVSNGVIVNAGGDVMTRHVLLGTLILAGFAATAMAQPQTAAGRIKIASGSAFIVRAGSVMPAQAGQLVYESDALRTGTDGRLGVTLKDDTRISIGPGSELRVDRFLYAPAEGRLALVLNVVRGVVAYVSGRIAKLSPDSIRLETPAAVVGVRGTTLALRIVP